MARGGKKFKKRPCLRCDKPTRGRFHYTDDRQTDPADQWLVPVCKRCAPAVVIEFGNDYLPQPEA